MAAPRDESALFFTGDENLVELAGVVEYRFARTACRRCCSAWRPSTTPCQSAAEGVFREVAGRTPLESIFVSGRREFESAVAGGCSSGCSASGLEVRGRPGAGGRRPSAARGRAGLSRRLGGRLRCRAEPEPGPGRGRPAALVGARRGRGHPRRGQDAGRLAWSTAPRAKARLSRQGAAHAARPRSTEFRLLWDTLATTLPGRPS